MLSLKILHRDGYKSFIGSVVKNYSVVQPLYEIKLIILGSDDLYIIIHL